MSTTNDSAYDTVADLHAAGIDVAAVVDARPELSDRAAEVAAATGVRVLTGSAVVDTAGEDRLTGVTVQALDAEGRLTGDPESFDCDLLAVSGGWSPVVHLHSQRQGRLRWDAGAGRLRARRHRTGPAGRRGGPRDVRPRRLSGRGGAGRCAGGDGRGVPGARTGRTATRGRARRPDARPVAGARTRGRTRQLGQPLRRPPARRHGRRRLAVHRRRECAASSTSSATPRSARRTTRARRPASTRSG